jgi:integrase
MGFSVSTRQPSYVYQCPSGYIFRLRVPEDLKELVGKCEFRYSLRAGALRVAKQRARAIAAYIQQLFIKVRNSMSDFTPEQIARMVQAHIREVLGNSSRVGNDKACNDMPAAVTPGSVIIDGETILESSRMHGRGNGKVLLPPERIAQLVQKYLLETLDNDEKCRAIGGTVTTDTVSLGDLSLLEASNMGATEAQSVLKSVTRWLQLADHSVMRVVTKRILTAEGVAVDPESETYQTLSRELLRAFQGVLNVRILRSTGDYSVPDSELIPRLKGQPRGTVAPPVVTIADISIVRFSEVQKRYIAEAEQGGNWRSKTKAEYIAIFGLFVRIMGDLDIKKIDRQMMSSFKDMLTKLPPNLNKNPAYRDKSIDDILASKPKSTLASRSVNKHLTRMGSLFNFAVNNGYMQVNPATDMHIKIKVRADQDREAFTTEDLQSLFSSEDYTDGSHKYPSRFWTPLIALYAGCRLEEICQLHLEDLRQEGGVWVFDINAKDGRQLKNISSARLVPIHPYLIELGILEHVDTVRAAGADRLFPELNNRQHGKYGHTVSRWFATFRKKCGIADGKTFHSFRHTFTTHLKHKQVDPFMLQELDGHAVSGETMGRYGKRYTPDILLREAIEKIDYGLQVRIMS